MAINQRAALDILACALTALVYQRALDLPFVFDDRTTVLLNPALVNLWDLRTLLLHDPPRTVVNLWAYPMRLWEEATQRAPDAWQAHLGYAESLREIGQCERAIPEYEATLRLYADQPQAQAGLSACRP